MVPPLEQIDPIRAPNETLTALHELWVVSDAEDIPGDGPIPLAQRMADWKNPHDHSETLYWVIRDNERAVAHSVAWTDREQNLSNGFGWVFVHPEHRGHGLGRTVAGPMLDTLQADRRARFATEIKDGAPGEGIAERGDLKPAYREIRSRLQMADLDWDLMDQWVAGASERARDYELMLIEHPVPEEMVEQYAGLNDIMNTAPREDFEEDDEVMTLEMVRDIDVKQVARGRTLFSYVAVHKTSGQWVGYTQIAHQGLYPRLAHQWNTGVHPDHRNHGLGRWLKAQMITKFREAYPDVERVDTWNAGSNQSMLNINQAMGFAPIFINRMWQGDIATLRERLDV